MPAARRRERAGERVGGHHRWPPTRSPSPGGWTPLARYPQLSSRIGFAHHDRPLSGDEPRFVLAHHWQRRGLTLSGEDFTVTREVVEAAREPLVIGAT